MGRDAGHAGCAARDRDARPSLNVVLDLRRQAVDGPGWPEPRSYPMRECLLCILNEEWEHRLYVERDLNALEAAGQAAKPSDR
ncbi:MAG: hypothetical protein ACRDWY_00325 [Actinomycetes bacterium]